MLGGVASAFSPQSFIIFIIVNPNQKIKTHSQKG
jgi:hypothetical protein